MRILTIVLCTFLSVVILAQRTEKVELTILYHADSHQSVDQAKMLAVEEAKVAAIDSVFGTNVKSSTANLIHVGGGKELDEFVSISNNDVRGRWVKDLAEPVFGKIWYENNMLNVYVTVKGRVREIKEAPIQCKVRILCDGTDDDNVREDFRNGNNIYLSFTSPVDGYLVVYLVDDKHDAYRVLPYYHQHDGAYRIVGGKEYMFFSPEHASEEERPYVEPYKLVTDKELETNLLYVIFSPNKFTKPVDTYQDDLRPFHLSWREFQSWLSKCMNHDDDMIGELPIMLQITK